MVGEMRALLVPGGGSECKRDTEAGHAVLILV